MAIIISGQSVCPLCGNPLFEKDEIIGLPAISDTRHPLYHYFDQGFHLACFQNWGKKEEIENILLKEMNIFEQSDYFKEILRKHGKIR